MRGLLMAMVHGLTVALAAVAMWMGPAQLPAVSAEARGAAPDGGWRAGPARDVFSLPAYHLALAAAHLDAAGAVHAEDPGAARRHGERADDYARRALSLRPMDPYAWAAAARAARFTDDAAAAQAALERSYAYGPASVVLAYPRVVTGYDLWSTLSPTAREAMLRDFRLMRWRDDPRVDAFLAAEPRARALNRLARAAQPSS